MNPKTIMHTISSSDLSYSAFVITRGGKIVSLDKSNPRRAVFVLQSALSEEDLKTEFQSNVLVPVQDFIAAQAAVKKCLFSDVW